MLRHCRLHPAHRGNPPEEASAICSTVRSPFGRGRRSPLALRRRPTARQAARAPPAQLVAPKCNHNHCLTMQKIPRSIVRLNRATQVAKVVIYIAIAAGGVTFVLRGLPAGWIAVGVGVLGLALRVVSVISRRHLKARAGSRVQPSDVRGAQVSSSDERLRRARQLKVLIAAYCAPFAIFAVVALIFSVTTRGEFQLAAVVLTVVFASVVCVLSVALSSGLRRIRTSRSRSSGD